MARHYTRDNRGRFASVGATARGGRLATAAGNKRATQTAKIKGGAASGTIGKPKGLKPGAISSKLKPQVSSARQAATERLKIKTATRRSLSADRGLVVTPGQRSRLEAGRGLTMAGARPASTVAKTRTKGNTKRQVASRVERKLAAERAKMNIINRFERVGATQGNQRERSYKRQATLERAQTFLKTGKLPGKDNSIAAQRSMKQARERLAAKNAARQRADRAEANIPMRGARGRRLDAEITRNVNAQKRQERAADKARNRQAKTEVSRAKKLRDAHIGSIAKAKGLSKGQVESALKAQPASTQIKALKNWVKVNRAAVKPPAAKPGSSAPARRRGVVGKIDDAKAGRIIGRIDANRPGLRRASGSARKTANAIKTQRKAVDFALAAGARARKQGKSLSVNDSLRRAVANAAKKTRSSRRRG